MAEETRGKIKRQWERRVTSVLVALIALFVVFFVPQEIAKPITDRLTGWQNLVVKLGASVPIMLVLPWIIFAQDHLATGRSKASKFFRDHYPSTFATAKYGLPREQADKEWFDYFNKWEAAGHPDRGNYEITFQRSYSLRLIYYLKRVLLSFILLALVATTLSWLLNTSDAHELLAARLSIVVLAVLILGWLHSSNRFWAIRDRAGQYDATGAYFKYKEINGVLRMKFEADVLSKRNWRP